MKSWISLRVIGWRLICSSICLLLKYRRNNSCNCKCVDFEYYCSFTKNMNIYVTIMSERLMLSQSEQCSAMSRTSYYSMRWWCPTPVDGFWIVLAHRDNILQIDMSIESDTLFWFRTNRSLHLFLKDVKSVNGEYICKRYYFTPTL